MKEQLDCRAEDMCLMAAPSYLSFVAFLTCLWILTKAEDTQEVKAKPGDDVLLQCSGPKHATPKLMGWNRSDMKSHDYVFFYRDDRFYEKYQHEYFHGRVELRHPQVKDGDVSVIIKKVNIKDTGTYECYVGYEGSPELITTINLTVRASGADELGGDKRGHVGLIVGLSVVVLVVVSFMIYKNAQESKSADHQIQKLNPEPQEKLKEKEEEPQVDVSEQEFEEKMIVTYLTPHTSSHTY